MLLSSAVGESRRMLTRVVRPLTGSLAIHLGLGAIVVFAGSTGPVARAPRRVARPRADCHAGAPAAPAARPARCRHSAPIRPSTGRRAARDSGPAVGAGGAGDATGATSAAASARGGNAGAADPESAGADAHLEHGGVEGGRARPQRGTVERGCDERGPIDRRVSDGRAARARHRRLGKTGRRVPNARRICRRPDRPRGSSARRLSGAPGLPGRGSARRHPGDHDAAHSHRGGWAGQRGHGGALGRTSIPGRGGRRSRAPLALRAGAERRGAGVDVGGRAGRVSDQRPGLTSRVAPPDRRTPSADSPACSGCPARRSRARRPGGS